MAVFPAIARRLLEETYIHGNLEAIDQIMPADAVVHELHHDPAASPAETVSGRDVMKNLVTRQREIIPELHVEIDTFLNAGHTITALCTLSGTATNGESASWNMIAIMHFHDSKIAETWLIDDRLGMYQQLGVVSERLPVPSLAGSLSA